MKFEKTSFGAITIDGKTYSHDVYLLDNGINLEKRDKSHSKRIKGHRCLSKWELKKLLASEPDYLIIGTGQRGVLPMTDDTKSWLKSKLKEASTTLVKDKTPNVLKKTNSLLKAKEKVNGVFHTTC